ncbi:MAG: universal stress protein [bacterium]|nr:universal stress protein [bacterium]
MKFVVAIDGSRVAKHALAAALDLAAEMRTPAELHAVAVADYAMPPAGLAKAPADAPDLLGDEARVALDVACEIAAARGFTIEAHLLRGHVSVQILEFARSIGANLIAAGTHGRKGLARALVGSTCERLVRQAEIPVLTVRGEDVS